jgi:heme exporter protein D
MHIWHIIMVTTVVILVVLAVYRRRRATLKNEERNDRLQEAKRQCRENAETFYTSIKDDDEKLSDEHNSDRLFHLYWAAGIQPAYPEQEVRMAGIRHEVRSLLASDDSRHSQMRILNLTKDAPDEVINGINNFDFDARLEHYTRRVKADINQLVNSLDSVESEQLMRQFLFDPVYSFAFCWASGIPGHGDKRSEWAVCRLLGIAPDLAMAMQRWNEWLVRHYQTPAYSDFVNMKSEFGPGELFTRATLAVAVGASILDVKYILALCAYSSEHRTAVTEKLYVRLGLLARELESSVSRS